MPRRFDRVLAAAIRSFDDLDRRQAFVFTLGETGFRMVHGTRLKIRSRVVSIARLNDRLRLRMRSRRYIRRRGTETARRAVAAGRHRAAQQPDQTKVERRKRRSDIGHTNRHEMCKAALVPRGGTVLSRV